MKKITLIKGWRTWWRWWSTWITAVALFIFNFDTVEAILYAYDLIPPDIKLAFTTEQQRAFGTVAAVVGFMARFLRQRKAHEQAEKQP